MRERLKKYFENFGQMLRSREKLVVLVVLILVVLAVAGKFLVLDNLLSNKQKTSEEADLFSRTRVMNAEAYDNLIKKDIIKEKLVSGGEVDSSYVKDVLKEDLSKASVERIGDSYVFITGKSGAVEGSVEKDVYKVEMPSIDTVDIKIPATINTSKNSRVVVTVAVKKGTGRVDRISYTAQNIGFPFKAYAQDKNESQVAVLVFADTNGNGEYDKDEKVLPWAGVNVGLDKLNKEKKIELIAGWNLVTLSVLPEKPLTASVLAGEIAKQGGYSTTVSTLENGLWKSYVTRGDKVYSNKDFPIEPGRAYFVKALKKSTIVVKGQEFVAPVELDFKDGWNAVGFPKLSKALNAGGLMDALQGKKFDADALARWESGLWDTFVKKAGEKYGENFDIESIRGYILRVKKGGKATL